MADYEYTIIENTTVNGIHLLVERTFDIYKKLSDPTLNRREYTASDKYYTAREYLLKYTDCWEIKENALTLIYVNFNA